MESEENKTEGRKFSPKLRPPSDAKGLLDTEGLSDAALSGPTLRPSLRDEDPKAAAARRAAQLRSDRASTKFSDDEFDVSHLDGEGWTYEWHTYTVYEQRQVTNMMSSQARGWEPVPRVEFPEMMPRDSDNEHIIRKGMILVRLPTEIVEEYRSEQLKDARDQIRHKEQQIAGTPDGTFSRDHAQARPRINKGYEPMAVPDR